MVEDSQTSGPTDAPATRDALARALGEVVFPGIGYAVVCRSVEDWADALLASAAAVVTAPNALAKGLDEHEWQATYVGGGMECACGARGYSDHNEHVADALLESGTVRTADDLLAGLADLASKWGDEVRAARAHGTANPKMSKRNAARSVRRALIAARASLGESA